MHYCLNILLPKVSAVENGYGQSNIKFTNCNTKSSTETNFVLFDTAILNIFERSFAVGIAVPFDQGCAVCKVKPF